jgi:hypothetical protein
MRGAAAPKNSACGGLGEGRSPDRRPSLGRYVAFGLSFSLPILFLVGCGIETVTYYTAPNFAYSGNLITLTSTNSGGNFIGYDIYYRAYGSFTDAETARNTIESATNSTSATPQGVILQMSGTMGFKKIYLASNPLISPTPLLKGSGIYYIQPWGNSSTVNWYFTSDVVSSQTQIVRGVGSKTNNSFNYQYLPGDVDYGSATGVTQGNSVFIVAFAVAYGYDVSTLTEIYSFPASLYQEIGGSTGYQLPSS